MDEKQRQSMITWLMDQIREPYKQFIKEDYSLLEGLPADDDGESLKVMIDEMDDEELDASVRMGKQQLTDWVSTQMKEFVINGWFRNQLAEVLYDNAMDTLVDHPEISVDDLHRAITYLMDRADVIDLVERFEDDGEKWATLVKLANSDTAE